MFDQIDWLGLIAWTVFVYMQVYSSHGTGLEWYERRAKKIVGIIPSWAFVPVWLVWYAVLTAAGFLYWRDDTYAHYTPVLGLFVAHLLVNKAWMPLFFGWKIFSVASASIIVMIGSAIALVVMMGLDEAWASMGLMIPYTVWLFYPLYLNIRFTIEVEVETHMN